MSLFGTDKLRRVIFHYSSLDFCRGSCFPDGLAFLLVPEPSSILLECCCMYGIISREYSVYIHGVFSIKGGRVPYCIGNYCHNLWRDACIGNAEGNFTDNADTTPRITSAKVVEHCQFCICRNAVWRLDVCSFAGY